MVDYDLVYSKVIHLCPSLRPFMKCIQEIPPMQKNEYNQLRDQYRHSDVSAKKRIMEIYLHVAIYIALKQSEIYDLDIEDAIGDACVGLATAVDECWQYDNARSFHLHASKIILQNIRYAQHMRCSLLYY